MEVNEAVTTVDAATDGQQSTGAEFDADALVAAALNGQPLGDLGAGESGSETPTEGSEGQGDGDGVEIDGERYDMPTLKELLATAKDAKEVKAESTRRFQEAARIKEEATPFMQLKEAWESGPEAQAKILEFFQAEAAKNGAEVPVDNAPEVAWDDLSPEGQMLYRQNVLLRRELSALKGQVVPTLEDVKGFVGSTRAEQEAMAQAKAIKDQYGIDLTPAQLSEMREALSDPVKAIGYLRSMAPASAKTEAAPAKVAKAVEMPTPSGKVFDPGDKSADDIIALMLQGFQPIAKATA